MRIGNHLVQPATVLAPMAGITNPPFRQICLDVGAGLTVTEMLSARQLIQPAAPIPIHRCESERTLVVQLFGRDPRQMADAAVIAVDHGADVVDLNMGCPARKVVKQGAGVALMQDVDLAARLTGEVVKAVDCPVTVKMRSGFSRSQQNAVDVARAVVDAGAAAVAVHARVRQEVHTGHFDWSVIADVRRALPAEIPVVGNGGVTSAEDAAALRAQTGCEGVMIGRAARGNPWLFRAIADGRSSPSIRPPLPELKRVMLRHLELYVQWGGEDRAVREMRKHLCWYLKGFPGAAKLRHGLSQLDRQRDVETLIGQVLDVGDGAAGEQTREI
jgi:nifR3 family TIM-barrel protein